MGRVLIVVAAVMFMPSTASASRPDCGPDSGRTIERSAAVRVYYTQHGASKDYYACWRRTHGKPLSLTDGGLERPEFLNRFRLRGRYLTFVHTSCSRVTGCDSFSVETIDVEARSFVAYAEDLLGGVRTLVATRGGAAAFLASDGHGVQYVQKLDSLGVEEIDRGPDVHSLTLHGGRLHWLHGEQPRDDHIAHVRRCGPTKGAYTQVLSRRIRVYVTDPFGDQNYHSYACLLGGGKPFFLGEDLYGNHLYDSHEDFRPVGEHLFWFEYDCGPSECVITLHSADLSERTKRDGRGFHTFGRDVPTLFPNSGGFAAVLYRGYLSPTDYWLYSFDSRGEELIDSGPGIDPESIRVYPDAIAWRHDGEERSAPLR
jgi:hypothetical protein